jgi:hypothetical protein
MDMREISRIVAQQGVEMFAEIEGRILVFGDEGIKLYGKSGEVEMEMKGRPYISSMFSTQLYCNSYNEAIEYNKVKMGKSQLEMGR